MTTRCQARLFRELSASSRFSFPAVVFFSPLPNIAARAEPVSFGSRIAIGDKGTGSTMLQEFFARLTVVLLAMPSMATSILSSYRRRDYASPRRIGRRI